MLILSPCKEGSVVFLPQLLLYDILSTTKSDTETISTAGFTGSVVVG